MILEAMLDRGDIVSAFKSEKWYSEKSVYLFSPKL